MNKNNFYKIHTIDGDKYLSDDYTKQLYDYYVTGGILFKYEINIEEEQFERLFQITYEILKTKLTEEEIKKAFIQYIQIIIDESREKNNINLYHFINKTDYLALDILNNTFLKKAKPLIKEIKKQLIKEFGKNKSQKTHH